MLEFVTGSIFDSDADCIVNPVNCVGAMGGGLALDFKRQYPEMFSAYQGMCQSGELAPGRVTFWTSVEDPLTTVCLFPTKNHWKYPSTVKMIDDGMKDFIAKYEYEELESVAFPMLGCGLGGLNFEHQVLPLFVRHFESLPLAVTVYVAP